MKKKFWKIHVTAMFMLFLSTFPLLYTTTCNHPSVTSQSHNSKDYFLIDQGVLVKLTNEGKRQTSLVIPNDINMIDIRALSGCKNLQNITISDSVKDINFQAFSGCSALTSITFPNSVESIDRLAFYACTALEKAIIPSSVSHIGGGIFLDCSKLKNVISNSRVLFDWWVWRHTYNEKTLSQITDIDLTKFTNSQGKPFTIIGDYAFNGCTELTTITIPTTITRIGYEAFNGCNSLKSITIPNNVLNIDVAAFNECKALKEVIISDNVESIADLTFADCSQLQNIIIPNRVTSIGGAAFYNCFGLKTVTFKNGSQIANISHGAFKKCGKLTQYNVPNQTIAELLLKSQSDINVNQINVIASLN